MNAVHPWDAEAFARLSLALQEEKSSEDTLQRVVEQAVATIEGADFVGVTIARRGRPETPASTDPVAVQADAAQYALSEGPCLSSLSAESWHAITNMREERRWPNWAPRAADLGIMSALSVRLATPEQTVGALNLYSTRVAAFDQDALLVAQIYGMHASAAIAASSETDHLHLAMRTRHQIGLAQGMLMVRYGLTEEQAFQFLARVSQDTNQKLRDVAVDVANQLKGSSGTAPT